MGRNDYAYSSSNPITLDDPSGLCPSAQCQKLAQSLGFGPNFQAPSSLPPPPIDGAVVALFTLIRTVDVYRHRHPLNGLEILALSRKRQRNRALSKFDFSTMPRPAVAAEKKAMKAQGEFVACDLVYRDAPARVAGLLKYKKHEWIVVAFINSLHVRQLWWNKGPDRTRVWGS